MLLKLAHLTKQFIQEASVSQTHCHSLSRHLAILQYMLVATNKKINFRAVANVKILLHLFLHLKPFSPAQGQADEGEEGRTCSAQLEGRE